MFGAHSSPTCANYTPKRAGLDSDEVYPIASKAMQNNFYMDDFIKSVETPEEAIEVLSQLRHLLSLLGFQLTKWISNSDKVLPKTEGCSVLGLQWTVNDDSLQVCRGTNREVEVPITQRKILSLLPSVFDPIGLFASFSVSMRRILKGIWTKKGQHWDNQVEPGQEAEFLRRKEQLPIVAETSIGRRCFNRESDKTKFMCLLMHRKTQCVQWPIKDPNQRNTQPT